MLVLRNTGNPTLHLTPLCIFLIFFFNRFLNKSRGKFLIQTSCMCRVFSPTVETAISHYSVSLFTHVQHSYQYAVLRIVINMFFSKENGQCYLSILRVPHCYISMLTPMTGKERVHTFHISTCTCSVQSMTQYRSRLGWVITHTLLHESRLFPFHLPVLIPHKTFFLPVNRSPCDTGDGRPCCSAHWQGWLGLRCSRNRSTCFAALNTKRLLGKGLIAAFVVVAQGTKNGWGWHSYYRSFPPGAGSESARKQRGLKPLQMLQRVIPFAN
jgi:hypothetical protein